MGMFADQQCFIRKTCPCNEYPLIPHFYVAKLGYDGIYLFFLFLLQNIECGYLLELLSEVVLTCIHVYVLNKIKKNIKHFLQKIINFFNLRKISILHGPVFIMFA